MDKRRFGSTNHASTLAIFGAVALGKLDQRSADKVMQNVLDAGINHIDVAPSYGKAEQRLGPWMPRIRENVFLGCKTMERSKPGTIKEFHQSLKNLRVERFDLFQLHAVTSIAELDECTKSGGALEGLIEMREQGLTDYIGITGHGMDSPAVFIEALARFDFDSVLFPINPTLFADDAYRNDTQALLDRCKEKDVGVMVIKSVAKEPWGERDHRYHTWYTPFEQAAAIQESIDFVLSHPFTHICSPGDYRLLDMVFSACENFKPMSVEAQESLIEKRSELAPIF